MPASLALLGAAFSGEARGRAIGTWAAAGAITGALGPLARRLAGRRVGWRAIFLVNLPLAAAAAWLAWRYVAESRRRRRAAARLGRRGAGDRGPRRCSTYGLTVSSPAQRGAADGVRPGRRDAGLAAWPSAPPCWSPSFCSRPGSASGR